ncbi:MAG: DNA polymerase III subunit delta [Clostridia bacterium]|nr:DNA polymerase III subunit delta [Clostridia bacterium]
MNYTEFKNGLENGQRFPIYLFEGEDAFFRERGLRLLKDKCVLEPELNYAVFEGDKFSEKDFLSSLFAFPIMSEKRMTVLREYYPKASGLSAGIKDYFKSPVSESILVILNEKPSEQLKKFDTVCVVDCKKADLTLISRYVKGKCANSGVAIDLETARLVGEYCLSDMTRIESETEKLISYAFSKKVITIEDVELLVTKDTEYKIFEMTDYIGKKDFDKAITIIHEMLGKGETLPRILVSVYNYFRKLLHVAISQNTDVELAKMLGTKDFVVRKTRQQAKAFKKKSLKMAVDMLADTDYLIKTGTVDATDRIWYTLFTVITA